ncbi:MAG: LEA type 2 family protein [Proteobacteria bacterium]|nr:LEA type 2 family protein [Pseudomonadota bacterium]MBU1712404.1 LEA type 2 family protein [Pseudomonadota bacterium]
MARYNTGKQSVRIAGGFLLILILSGCAGCGTLFEQPGLKIHSIHIKKIRNLEAFFRVDIEVYNPNLVSFEIKNIECEVEMEGKPVASVAYEVNALIPSRTAVIVPFEVQSTSFDMIATLLNILKSNRKTEIKKIEYKINGKINLSSPFYAPSSIAFRSEGNLLEKLGILKQQ